MSSAEEASWQDGRRPAVLITGSHRSGSTWMGKLLGASAELLYVHEPFNPEYHPSWMADSPTLWYQLPVPGGSLEQSLDGIMRLHYPVATNMLKIRHARHGGRVVRGALNGALGRRRELRPLIKDPFLVFAAHDLNARYDCQVIFTVRNPAAFTSSLLRLDWRFDFGQLAQQDVLMDRLEPWSSEIRQAASSPLGPVDEACLLWRIIHGSIANALPELGPSAQVVIHEEFVTQVPYRLEKLSGWLNIAYSNEMRDTALALSEGSRQDHSMQLGVNELRRNSLVAADAWRERLSPADVQRIRELTVPEAYQFYPEGF